MINVLLNLLGMSLISESSCIVYMTYFTIGTSFLPSTYIIIIFFYYGIQFQLQVLFIFLI